MNHKNMITIPLLLILVILVACSTPPSTVIDDKSCNAPCWRMIEVGKTTKEEAINNISKISDIQKDTIRQDKTFIPLMEEGMTWRFQNVIEFNGDLSFHNDKVVGMYFNFSRGIPFKNLHEKYWEPASVILISTGAPISLLTVSLIYPDIGVCLESQKNMLSFFQSKEYTITQRMEIKNVYYIDPSIENGQIKIGCLRGLDESLYNQISQEWSGYRKYNVFNSNEPEK